MARMKPLPPDATAELQEQFAHFAKTLGFVPNSFLTMQRRPKIVKAFTTLNAAVFDPEGEVPLGFKRLIGHVASHAAGCQYCKAHTAVSARRHGIDDEKIAAVWEYRTSPLFPPAERIALDFALAAASVPNGVTDEMFAELKRYWNEAQIVEILSVVAMFGFLNRWNDTLATTLEAEPTTIAENLLAKGRWSLGKHKS